MNNTIESKIYQYAQMLSVRLDAESVVIKNDTFIYYLQTGEILTFTKKQITNFIKKHINSLTDNPKGQY